MSKEKSVSVMIDAELVTALKRIQQGIKKTVDAGDDIGLTVEPSLGFIVRSMLRNTLGISKKTGKG
ncbi:MULTISPECIES: hypothetical protein [Enterobacter]|uniref:hypothetical protein n=1 Tax=Enterobacter TaxID=547 RepID=UPI002006ACBB|nr:MULTISPECIES: hypothetical protein [Enterobacter]MCK6991622.1 hypothetical protein [Enterobacter asburiae]MCM7634256.1 hypothetical protein [Enterobacter bugandensis]